MIPVIDLGLSGTNIDLSKKLVSILSTTGFVNLKNHGVPMDSMQSCREEFLDFFSKDLKHKESFIENNVENPFTGYKGCESEKLNPIRKEKDAREAMLFWAHNIKENRWPNRSMARIVVALVTQMGLLANRILKMLGVGLGLKDPDHLVHYHSAFNGSRGKSFTTFRVNHYPKLEEGELKGDQVLCGEHADYGSITLLIQDHVGGLEVQTKDGEFIEASPIEGTILLNVGLLLENWTNGRLRATRHRILSPLKEARMSIVLFSTTDEGALVEPLEELRRGDEVRYDAVDCQEFAKALYAKTLET